MRRSEMIKLMMNTYSTRLKDQIIYFTKEDADRVLTAMEASGILPPYNAKDKTDYMDSAANYNWELEND